MAYAVCMRARVTGLEHWRDNSLTGTLEHAGETFDFKTRGHIAKAVNAQYRDVSWKPTEGSEIIFDGDISGRRVILDHIEPWKPHEHSVLERHRDLQERLIDRLGTMPEMTKVMRHRAFDDEGIDVRLVRWMKTARAGEGRRVQDCIISAIIAEGDIRFAARDRSGAAPVALDRVALLPLIAGSLGIPSLILDAAPVAIPESRVSRNPNKWRPGMDYRPEGMPERDPFHPDALVTGPAFDDIPF